MKEKVTISRIFRGEVETKYGLKNKVAIKTDKHGDAWLSTFKTEGTEAWNDGDEVEVNVTESNGYLNFVPVIPDYGARIKALEDAVFGTKEAPSIDEITADEIPL